MDAGTAETPPGATTIARLRELYTGQTPVSCRFRYALMAFEVLALVYVIVTSFITHGLLLEIVDVSIGIVMLADFAARMAISRHRGVELLRLTTWTDLVAIASFLLPLSGTGGAFLRALRVVRLLTWGPLEVQLRRDSRTFRRNEDLIKAVVNLLAFVFVMTGLVFETQNGINAHITNYVDALYFTIATLTTTGFGDIVLTGPGGRLLSIVMMLSGITLFLRLAQVLFRPVKVRHPCPSCGLQRHEPDAVHCKACGTLLRIPFDGHG